MLIVIHPLDGEVKPGGPSVVFIRQTTCRHRVSPHPSFISTIVTHTTYTKLNTINMLILLLTLLIKFQVTKLGISAVGISVVLTTLSLVNSALPALARIGLVSHR